MKKIVDDPRLDFAVLLKMAHPEWSIARIAREVGGVDKNRVREELVEERLLTPQPRITAGTAAPAWYNRPCGRVQALRRAHGIEAMTDLFPAETGLAAQIACVKREIAMRRRVYPRWIETGRMTASAVQREIATMWAVLATLEKVAANG